MTKFHISNGKASACTATLKACPLGGEHYESMEDAATAEICRAQLWQWIRYATRLDDGRTITSELHDRILTEILDEIRASVEDEVYSASRFDRAGTLMRKLSTGDFEEFLTTAAYGELN